ncbi:MAG: NUDIX domain-containing protein [Pseudomonadales bacterium]|nr:NUDIX domain-containing protein [Pseudomonadales bacterium]
MEELFETFDESGTRLGAVARSEVHRLGYWHRASNIFLFRSNGKLLIQRRQLSKDICPGAWDVSAAEHLKPGETFEEGAHRGLIEELGIRGIKIEAWGNVVKARHDNPDLGIKDFEFQQSFKGTYDGPVEIDPVEVLETRDIDLETLESEMNNSPESFTPWFLRRAEDLQLFAGDSP